MNQHTPGRLEVWGEQQVFSFLENNKSTLSLKASTRLSLMASFAIGFLLTVALVLVEVFYFPDMTDALNNLDGLAIFILANVVLVGLEFYLLFKIGFYSVALYIKHSGLDAHHPELKLSLSRAILEIPEPGIHRLGLDPYKNRGKSHYLMLILYKMKTFATGFLAKLLVRKLLARTGFRAYSSLVAAPVTGFWDAWVMGVTLREAKTRISGRMLAMKLLEYMKENYPIHDDDNPACEYLIRLIAVRLVLFEEYNVNLDYLIAEVSELYAVKFNGLKDVSDTQLLLLSRQGLTENQFAELSDITRALFALKRKRLSEVEKQLLDQLNIPVHQVKAARSELDQFKLPTLITR
jgi:hypothetical protein